MCVAGSSLSSGRSIITHVGSGLAIPIPKMANHRLRSGSRRRPGGCCSNGSCGSTADRCDAKWSGASHHDEPRAPPQHRVDLDTMTEERCSAFDDKKPQPETVGTCRIHPVKRPEDVRQLASGDADAVVSYLQAYRRAARPGSNKHAATAGRIVDRVANQVSQYSAH